MNNITLPQNYSVPTYKFSPNIPPMISLYNQQFIRVISLALNCSLVCYQNSYKQLQSEQTASISKNTEKGVKIIPAVEIIEILSNDEQYCGNNINQKTHKNPSDDKTTISVSSISQKQSPSLPQVTSMEEKSLDPAKTSIQKKEKSKKKNNRIQKKKMDQFQVVAPEIDQIQAAYLPELGLQTAHIKMMRQKLLNRQVFQWVAKQKIRKERRQIRNLGN